MKPIVTKGTNAVFGGQGCLKLPAELYYDTFNGEETVCIQTVWELNDEEIETLIKTKRIYISTVGESIRPTDVSVKPYIEEQ